MGEKPTINKNLKLFFSSLLSLIQTFTLEEKQKREDPF